MSLDNVYPDKVLQALAEACPQDEEALKAIPGLSQSSRESCGDQILSLCMRVGMAAKRARDPDDADADAPGSKRYVSELLMPETIKADQLTEEQRKWASAAFAGESLFITGEAGTGKSFMLSYIVQELKLTKTVAITATTGIVAAGHGGVTLHAFAGIGLGKGSHEEIIAKTMMSGDAVSRWQETDVLVIDEISMLDGDTFTLLEKLA